MALYSLHTVRIQASTEKNFREAVFGLQILTAAQLNACVFDILQ